MKNSICMYNSTAFKFYPQEEMQHKVVRKLPRSIVINDVQFNKGLQTDFYKVSKSSKYYTYRKVMEWAQAQRVTDVSLFSKLFLLLVLCFFLQMISLENQMKKEGLLNKNHEIKEFWDFITVPENLEEVLEDGKCLI